MTHFEVLGPLKRARHLCIIASCRISKKPRDANQTAAAVVALATADDTPTDAALLSKVMAEMGRKGGKIGGGKSLEMMSAKDRRDAQKKPQKLAGTLSTRPQRQLPQWKGEP